jgi:hypothetical protein
MNKAVKHMANSKISKELVKQKFILHFEVVSLFGPLAAVPLLQWSSAQESLEDVTALFLLGSVWALQQYTHHQDGPTDKALDGTVHDDPEVAWNLILTYIGDWPD